MTYKHIAYTLVLALTSTVLQAQVKIGRNPTTLTPGALLDIEGSTTTTRTVSLTNGNFGIGIIAPVSKLDVGGPIGFFGTLANGQLTGGNNALILSAGTAGLFVNDNANSVTNLYISSGGLVGIGTTAPGSKLSVAGKLQMVDGTQGAGKILTSDAYGVASWASQASASQVNFFATFSGVRAFAANNLNTKIDFDAASPNVGGSFDAGADVFTAPVAGIYFFIGTTYIDSPNVGANGNASTYRDVLSFKVNGVARITQESFQFQQNSVNTVGNAFSISYLVRLNVGDRVELFGNSNKPNPEFVGYAASINAPQTTFQGFLIGQ